MSRRTITLLFLASLALPGIGNGVSGVGKNVAGSDTRPPKIDSRRIASHIRFLASDVLEGRETGTRGYDVAAEYVRAQFEEIGLQPLRDDWFQRFALRAAMLDESKSSFTIDDTPLVIRKDFLLRPDLSRDDVSIRAPLALAGFGVTAPELHHDDYAGIDAHGKIVVILSGAPKPFPADQRAYYSSTDVKRHNAAAHGAVGIITISTTTDEARNPFEKRVEGRSMSYSFVKAGIPAIHLKPGNKSTDPSIDGAKMTREWLRTIYHSPRDDMSQPFDFPSGARYAETNMRLVRAIADAPKRPTWTKGDFFGEMFGRGKRKATITLQKP